MTIGRQDVDSGNPTVEQSQGEGAMESNYIGIDPNAPDAAPLPEPVAQQVDEIQGYDKNG